jgi:hypothetical protein
MNKITGLICLGVGIALIVWGHNLARSVGGQMEQAFTGSPGDKPMMLYIAGGVLCVAGLAQILWKKRVL